jgi:hypothetical protein
MPEGYCQAVADVEITSEPEGAVVVVITTVTSLEPRAAKEPRLHVTDPPA